MSDGNLRKRFSNIEKKTIDEKLDFSIILRQRIDDCGRAAGNDELFAARVLILENHIIDIDKDDQYLEELEASNKLYRKWIYADWCGRPQGTPERPALYNDPEDLINYDPDGPTGEENIKSPKLSSPFAITDWFARFNAILGLLSRQGVIVKRPAYSG